MTSRPTFDNPLFEKLYERDYHIDEAVLREILVLGPAAAGPELLKIANATLATFDYDEDSGQEWSENFHFLHALYLLHALEAPVALDVYARLLKEEPENLEYWFGDWLSEELPELLAVAARSRPAELMAMLENGAYSLHNRQLIHLALLRLIRHDPSLRPQIVEFLGRYLRYIIDHAAQASMLFPPDADFYGYELDTYIGFLITEMQDAELRELDPEIRQLHRLGLVDESIAGGEDDINYERPFRPADPDDIFARYKRMREHPQDSSPYNPDAAAIAERKAQEEARRQERIKEYYQRGLPPQPRLAAPKIGRNDPCSCGSGKKYKKCCME